MMRTTATRIIPQMSAAAMVGGLLVAALFAEPEPDKHVELGTFKFAQMCDTQLGMGGYDHDVRTFELAVERLHAMRPDFVVICGDLVNKTLCS
jgi:hypothetical protein